MLEGVPSSSNNNSSSSRNNTRALQTQAEETGDRGNTQRALETGSRQQPEATHSPSQPERVEKEFPAGECAALPVHISVMT